MIYNEFRGHISHSKYTFILLCTVSLPVITLLLKKCKNIVYNYYILQFWKRFKFNRKLGKYFSLVSSLFSQNVHSEYVWSKDCCVTKKMSFSLVEMR